MFVHLSRVGRRPVTKVLLFTLPLRWKCASSLVKITSSGSSLNICSMVSAKVVLPKSCWFNSWTSINLYGWKFKSWCKIRWTVVSDSLRACAWRTADRRWLCSTAFRTASFSGVLTSCRPTLFLHCRSCGTEVVDPKKYCVSCRNPPVMRNIKMQTKLPLCDGYQFAVFKKRLHDERTVLRAPLLKLQNLTLPMLPLPWQLQALPSYTSCSKNVRFHWRIVYILLPPHCHSSFWPFL